MAIDRPTVFRIYLVRQILQQGVEWADLPLPLDRMRALLALDQAVELLVKTLLGHVRKPAGAGAAKTQSKQPRALMALFDDLVGAVSELQAYRSPVSALRDQRNAVQHDGMIPSSEEARTHSAHITSLARTSVELVFRRPLEEFSPLFLVENARVREYLEKAGSALKTQDHREAIIAATAAFDVADDAFSARLRIDLTPADHTVAALMKAIGRAATEAVRFRSDHDRDLREFAREFASRLSTAASLGGRRIFEPLYRSVALAEYGISMSELRRFDETKPVLVWHDDDFMPITPDQWNPTPAAAAFMVDFVTRAALQLEEWMRLHPEALRIPPAQQGDQEGQGSG
jgi:hypothetical protein